MLTAISSNIQFLQFCKNLLFSPHQIFISDTQLQESQISLVPLLFTEMGKSPLLPFPDHRNKFFLSLKNPSVDFG